jgi:hypothetical protein
MIGHPQLLAAPTRAVGHPVWHLLIVAIASVAVFAGLKIWEWWRLPTGRHASRDVRARQAADFGRRRPWARPSSPQVVWVALASAGCSVAHAAVGPAHFHEFVAFGVFFVVASVLQAVWALLVIRRADRLLLAIGVAGNAAVLALWAVTRTVGLPFGPEVWRPEAVAAPDVFASLLELTVVVGALWLLHQTEGRRGPVRPSVVSRLLAPAT